MRITELPLPATENLLSITKDLNHLLADQYILMNKTVSLLLGLAITPDKEMTEQVYDELKKNVKDITRFFMNNVHRGADISISNFLNHTRLQIASGINSNLSEFKLIIFDHQFIINELDATIRHYRNTEVDMCLMLQTIKQRHSSIATTLSAYLKQNA